MGQILAAGDIGSNTAHLLVAEVGKAGEVSRISDTSEWISLGEIVGRTGRIPTETATQLVKTLLAFKRLATFHKAERIYIFGTEALRRASNSKEILKLLKDQTGIKVELIDGRREAEIGLKGTWIDAKGDCPFLLCEIGGGSAQVSICDDLDSGTPQLIHEASLRLGTGTLIAGLQLTQPVSSEAVARLQEHIEESLDVIEFLHFEGAKPERFVTCGGVARGMWRALHPDGKQVIRIEELDYLIWATQRLSSQEIAARFHVKLKRSSTLLPGACVFRSLMIRSGYDEMFVSRFGVREGAVIEMTNAPTRKSASGKVAG